MLVDGGILEQPAGLHYAANLAANTVAMLDEMATEGWSVAKIKRSQVDLYEKILEAQSKALNG